MKKIIFACLGILIGLNVYSQHWIDAYKVGQGNTTAGGNSFLDTDPFGNMVYAGAYTNSISIDGNIFNSASSALSCVIVKRDANRNYIWGKSLSCGKNTVVQGVYIDNTSNIYVTGFFGDSLNPTTLNCNPFPLSNTNGFSTFVIKYAPNGAVIWSRSLKTFTGSGNYTPFYNITGNGTNKITIVSPITTVPSFTLGSSVINPANGRAFYAQIDNNGNWLFGESFGITGNNLYTSSISMAANDDIFISGIFKGSMPLGAAGTLTTTPSVPLEFVCKVNSTGGFAWAKTLNNSGFFRNEVIAVNNDALMLGTFSNSLALASTTISSVPALNSTYFAKIDNAGNWLWLKKYGNQETKFFGATRTNNKIYLSGYTSNAVLTNTINTLVLNYSLTMSPGTPTTNPCFVIESDLNGNPVKGAVCYLGFSTLNINDMAASNGKVYSTGILGNTVNIGNYTLTGVPTNAYNFVATYADSASLITGRTFYDMNSNNVFDAGDVNYPVNLTVKTSSTSFNAYSNGTYKIPVGVGTYSTSASVTPLYYTASPTGTYVSTFTVNGQLDTARHFYYKPIPNQNDLKVKLTMGRMRPGFSGVGFIDLTNVGTTVKSGTLTMVVNPSISVMSSTPAPLSITANTVNFSYTNLNPTMVNNYVFTYSLSNSAVIGNKAKSYVYATDPLDLTPSNNSDTANVTITASYDPNNKEVSPAGNITPSFVSAGNYLDYTIHFQNTGTDTAYTVIVKDTLSSFLDLSSFQLTGSSKPVLVDMTGNLVDFKFYGINLPDSTTNKLKSCGYVSYRIKPKSTATIGDVIKNTAFIYFDFNSPIVTNTTNTPIQLVSGIEDVLYNDKYTLYPNPTAYSLYLNSKSGAQIKDLKIYNMEGKLVQVMDVHADETEINVSSLSSGLYLMSFRIGDTTITKKFIKN